MEKMVTVKLPKAGKTEEQEVFVGVNGRGWRIQKGIEVKVPDYVAEVLRNAENADEQVDAFVEANKDKAAE